MGRELIILKVLLLSIPIAGFLLLIWHIIWNWSDYYGQNPDEVI